VPDLSSFSAMLDFCGASKALAVSTEADVIVFAPNNAAMDAFAAQVTGDPKATFSKALLRAEYAPLLARIALEHVTEDDDDDGMCTTLGRQALLVTGNDGADDDDDSKKADKKLPRVTTMPSKKMTATILREQDLGDAGDLYVVDCVLVPDALLNILKPTTAKVAVPAAAAAAAAAPKKTTGGRKLLRTSSRNNIIANTQRANIRRAMIGSTSVAQAALMNNNVARLAPLGSVPDYFLTSSATNTGGFYA